LSAKAEANSRRAGLDPFAQCRQLFLKKRKLAAIVNPNGAAENNEQVRVLKVVVREWLGCGFGVSDREASRERIGPMEPRSSKGTCVRTRAVRANELIGLFYRERKESPSRSVQNICYQT
jgi:hypothetical protein